MEVWQERRQDATRKREAEEAANKKAGFWICQDRERKQQASMDAFEEVIKSAEEYKRQRKDRALWPASESLSFSCARRRRRTAGLSPCQGASGMVLVFGWAARFKPMTLAGNGHGFPGAKGGPAGYAEGWRPPVPPKGFGKDAFYGKGHGKDGYGKDAKGGHLFGGFLFGNTGKGPLWRGSVGMS